MKITNTNTNPNPVILTDDHQVEHNPNTHPKEWGYQFLQIDIPKSEISKKTIDVLNSNLLGNDLSVWSQMLIDNDLHHMESNPQWKLVDGNWRTYIAFYNSHFRTIEKLSKNQLFNNVTMKIYSDTRNKLGYQRVRNGELREMYFVSKLKPELFNILKIQLEEWELEWNNGYGEKTGYESRVGHINLIPEFEETRLKKEYNNELYVRLSNPYLRSNNYFSQLIGEEDESIETDQFSFNELYKSFDILKDLNINYRVISQIKNNDNPLTYYYGCVRDWIDPSFIEKNSRVGVPKWEEDINQ